MAAEFETGMFVAKGAWHQEGIVLPEAPTTGEAIIAGGLGWTVEKRPLFLPGKLEPLPKAYQAVVRTSDDRVLGIAGESYTPLQNEDAFEWFDPFLEAGLASLETAGSLRGGECVWVLAKLKGFQAEVVPGDGVEKYLLLNNWHNGKRKLTVCDTDVRVVCMNTMQLALSKAASTAIRIRHHEKIRETLMELRTVVDALHGTFQATIEQYRAMQKRGLDVEGLKRYVIDVFTPDADEVKAASTVEESTEPASGQDGEKLPRAWESIEAAFESGPGADMAGKTVFGAYNAVTHWVDHTRGRTDESRLYGTWFGDGAKVRRKAFDAALALV